MSSSPDEVDTNATPATRWKISGRAVGQRHQGHAADRVPGEHQRAGRRQRVDQVGPCRGRAGRWWRARAGPASESPWPAVVPGDDADAVPELALQVAHLVVPVRAGSASSSAPGRRSAARRPGRTSSRSGGVRRGSASAVSGLFRVGNALILPERRRAAGLVHRVAAQLRLASSGSVASIDSGGGWRRRISRQSRSGVSLNRSLCRAGTTCQLPSAISSSSWPAPQPAYPA